MRRSVLAALLLLLVPASAAGAAENDPQAQALDTQMGKAFFAMDRVGVRASWSWSDRGDWLIDGTYDLNAPSFSGFAKLGHGRLRLFATPKQRLMRRTGQTCWSPFKEFTFGQLASLLITEADPETWIDKTTLGPVVFSSTAPNVVHWSLGGTTPVETDEHYDPATMLPSRVDVVQRLPKGATLTASNQYRYSGLASAKPKSLKRCRKR